MTGDATSGRRDAKVFGIGLPKTGTTTLAAMLRRLGYDHAPYDPDLIRRVALGEREPLWRRVEAHQSFEDWPWPAVFEEIDRTVPTALFILTLRKDAATWLASSQRHLRLNIERHGPNGAGPARMLWDTFSGPINPLDHPERMCAFYEAHAARVRAHFQDRPGKLLELCWETGDGWPDLCRFLDRPAVEGPLPHENSSESRVRRFRPSMLRRGLRWAARRLGTSTR